MSATFLIYQGEDVVPGLRFDNGSDAAAYCKAFPELGYKVKKQVEFDLYAELQKFEDGTYIKTPWHENRHYYTYFHRRYLCRVSKADGTMIEYTDPDSKVVKTMRPGRWLAANMAAWLNANEIELLAQMVGAAPTELKYAVTADEIEDIYLRGPSSCMSHPSSHYSSDEHPVRVYAGPDLQLAYITLPNDDTQVCGRVLVWPEQKRYGRLFSGLQGSDGHSINRTHEVRLQQALKAAGFETYGLRGARIQRIEHDGGFVCPYIDGELSVSDAGDYLTIGGPIDAQSTDGTVGCEDQDRFCEHCEDYYDSDTSFETVTLRSGNTQSWCEGCRSNHSFVCTGNGEYYSNRVPHDEVEGDYETYTVEYLTEHPERFVLGSDDLWYRIGTTAHESYLEDNEPEPETEDELEAA
jgi:hypothetical protein